MASNSKKNRKSSGSGSVAVGIISFLLGFIFALIVLVGSIFGVGYVAATTDINEVFRVFGLENENQEAEGEDDKYNYINADTAPNILALIQEIMGLANEFDTLNLNKIDALAPVTDTVLGFAYGFIDEVVDFDKEYFEDVPLTSIIDCLTNSVYYVRTSKVVELLDSKLGYSINDKISDSPILQNVINGIEAQYATVAGMGEDFKLPVLFDYYIKDEGGIGYSRTIPVNGISAYPTGLSTEYATETMSKNADNKTLYKVYYVPCKVNGTTIEEAEYIPTEKVVSDTEVSYVKDGVTVNLKYKFRTIEYGANTVFIAVKPQTVDGVETFVLDPATIESDDIYFADYARNYYTEPKASESNDRLYGVSTINNINYFRNVAGEIIEYDPLTVADIMIDAMGPLNNVPVYTVVNNDQTEVVKNIFGDTSLGDVLNNSVDFNNLINKIYLSTFLSDVSVTDKVMSYIVFNVSNITDDGLGNYTAIYDKGGENEKTVTLEVEGGKIKSVKDSVTNETLKGNNVGNLNQLTVNLTLDIFLDVKADDAIMAYLGYGIKDVVEVSAQDWQYEGKDTNGNKVRVYTDASGIITKVTDESNNNVKGTTVDEVSDRVDGIMDVISIPDLMDINPEEAIMVYLGYGVYDVVAVDGQDWQFEATYDNGVEEIAVRIYADTNNIITKVTDTTVNQNVIKGTKIGKVADMLDGITDVIAITEFIDIDPTDAIMAYMGYGINKVSAVDGTDSLGNSYSYMGTYGSHECYITVDSSGNIDSVWYIDGGVKKVISGTKVGNVPDKISSLQDTLTIGEIVEVTDSSSKILKALQTTPINGLDAKINTLTVKDVLTEEQINGNSVLPQLKDTPITELGAEIDKVLIQRIYAKEVYGLEADGDPTDNSTYNSAYLYYERTGNETDGYTYKIVDINCLDLEQGSVEYDNALGKLTEEQFTAGAGKYYTYGEAKGMWKLVLYRVQSDGSKTEKAYTLNNFDYMVNACSETVYNSTLNELKDAEIIESTVNLDKTIKTVDTDDPYDAVNLTVNYKYVTINESGSVTLTDDSSQAKKIGELSLKQLLAAIMLLPN